MKFLKKLFSDCSEVKPMTLNHLSEREESNLITGISEEVATLPKHEYSLEDMLIFAKFYHSFPLRDLGLLLGNWERYNKPEALTKEIVSVFLAGEDPLPTGNYLIGQSTVTPEGKIVEDLPHLNKK